jgi:hypothetical protein
MDTNPTNSRKKPLILLLILLAIFLIPFLLAWYLMAHNENLHEGTTNRGTLIQPPRNLADLRLQTVTGQSFVPGRKWLMLYINPNDCNADCQKMLYNMRQIRIATGKDIERVERVIVTFDKDPKLDTIINKDFPGTFHVMADKQQFQKTMAPLDSAKLALTQGYLYLVDPLGNIMMGYPNDVNPSSIFKDFQRLLKVSQIG